MRRFSASRVVLPVGILAVGVAVGVGASLSFLVPTTPSELQSGAAATSAPVTMQPYSDPLPADVQVTIPPPTEVVVMRSGTVTAWSCAAGTGLESGTSSVSIDGVGLLSLATAVPLWRDMSAGTSGPDVLALENELVRLGHAANADGRLSRSEMKAVAALAKNSGVTVTDVLARDAVVWLPGAVTHVEACALTLGGAVEAGAVLARVSAGVVVSPVTLPGSRLPGPRSLEVFGHPLPLGESGELPAELSSEVVQASAAFREAKASAPEATVLTLKGRTTLQTPTSVAAVPATAVLVDSAQATCVFAKRAPIPVTVVGSEFGNAFVSFHGEEPPKSVERVVSNRDASCG